MMDRNTVIVLCCAFLSVLLVAVAAIFIGSRKWVRIQRDEAFIAGIDPRLEGFRILHITDLHGDNPKRMHVNIWKKIESLNFDIAVITGDMITRDKYALIPHLGEIKKLADRKPLYYVEGNHDHFEFDWISRRLIACGVQILANVKIDASYQGTSYEIVGYRDIRHMKLSTFPDLLPLGNRFRLILIHQPQAVDKLQIENAPSLTLCGHTHGGQIRLPFFPTLYATGQGFFPKYGYGFYCKNGALVFISKGVGLRLRFWNRPEICLHTLRLAAD